MYVCAIGFWNVRGFTAERAVDVLPLPAPKDGGSWTVLAGRNGSGKSTFLRTLALAIAGPRWPVPSCRTSAAGSPPASSRRRRGCTCGRTTASTG